MLARVANRTQSKEVAFSRRAPFERARENVPLSKSPPPRRQPTRYETTEARLKIQPEPPVHRGRTLMRWETILQNAGWENGEGEGVRARRERSEGLREGRPSRGAGSAGAGVTGEEGGSRHKRSAVGLCRLLGLGSSGL